MIKYITKFFTKDKILNMNSNPNYDQFPWTPSGTLCLELILREVEFNGTYIYARENLTEREFQKFTREVYKTNYVSLKTKSKTL